MRFKYLRILLEDYKRTLRNKGVDPSTIRYVETLPNQDKGKAIAKLMANPKLNKDELTQEEFRLKDKMKHFDVMDADPTVTDRRIDLGTPTGQYYKIIAKWLMDRTLILPEDKQRVLEVLDYYNKNKNRFKTKYISKYNTFQDLEQEYLDVSGQRSKRQEIRDMKMEGAKKLLENREWKVYAITTPEAACYYGKGTRWCTTDDEYAKQYLREGPLYIFIDKTTNEKFQANYNFKYVMDEEDREVDYDIFIPIIEIAMKTFIENKNVNEAFELGNVFYTALYDQNFIWDRNKSELFLKYIETHKESIRPFLALEFIEYSSMRTGLEPFEKYIYTSPEASFKYALSTGEKLPKNIENQIFKSDEDKDLESAVDYTVSILKSPWPELEAYLTSLRNKKYLYLYIRRVYNDKLPLDSEHIFKEIGLNRTIDHALNVNKRIPWVEKQLNSGDPSIVVNNVFPALQYIKDFGVHLPKFFDYICEVGTSGLHQAVYEYTLYTSGWDEKKAEKSLLGDVTLKYSIDYAMDVKNKRWSALEDNFLKYANNSNADYKIWQYITKFKPKDLDEEILRLFMNGYDKDRIPRYFNEIKKSRAEDKILHRWIIDNYNLGVPFMQYTDTFGK